MRAVERLFRARTEFDDSWRAHAAAFRAVLVLGLAEPLAPSLVVALRMAKGFDPGFDGTAELDDIFDELEYLKSEHYAPMRKNCLLGVCAAFETFAKTFAGSLSYDENWRQTMGSSECLCQNTDTDFADRFSEGDRRWRRQYCHFLTTEFDWVDRDVVDRVGDVFWLRNQIAHNGGIARSRRVTHFQNKPVEVGQVIVVNRELLGACINTVRACVDSIAHGTPYMDAI